MAATSAFAQSAVTLYGNFDVSYGTQKTTTDNDESIAPGTDAYTANQYTRNKLTGVNGGAAPANFSSNAIGVMGSEDLGNGMKANFKIENSLTTVNGNGSAATSAFGGGARETWAGVSGGFGEARVGYQLTDEFAVLGGGEAGSGNLNQALNYTTGRQLRHDQISYTSPSFNGFTGVLAYGKGKSSLQRLNAGDTNQTTTETDRTVSSEYQAFGLKYANGPLKAAFGHSKNTVVNNYYAAQATATSGASGNSAAALVAPTTAVSGVTFLLSTAANAAVDEKVTSEAFNKASYMSASYDLGSIKLLGNYVKRKLGANGSVGADAVDLGAKQKAWTLGAQVPMGKTTVFASLGRGKQTNTDNIAAEDTAETKIKTYALGAVYSLSKRTSMYAAYTNVKVDAVQLPAAAGDLTNNTKITQTLVGLRHQF